MKPTLDFRDDLIDKEVVEKLSKEVSSYIIEQVKHNMDKSIEERAKEYAKGQWDELTAKTSYMQGALDQKAIDDAELAEVKSERNEYYDELTKLRRHKIELIEWLNEEASRCRELAKTGYDAYEIGTLEGRYTQAEETIEKIKAMEE